MSEIAVFAFESSAVRTLEIDGEPWFVASDIANILGFKHVPHMLRMLDDDEKGVHIVDTLGGTQEVTIINESGLYACILKSRRPEAKAFRKWVTSEVLPAIRKRGAYALPGSESGQQFVTGNLAHGADLVVAAERTFRSFLRAGRSAGLPMRAALRVANQKTITRTGMNMLHELSVDLDAPAAASPAPESAIDPLQEAIAAWAAQAEIERYYHMSEIVKAVAGVSLNSAAGLRIVNKIGPALRRLGLRCHKRRVDGGQGNYWIKEAK